MSITAAQRFRLGVFVVISIAAIFALLIVGIGVKFSKQTSRYYSEFMGESLSGLTKGMDVKFRGIPIGKVSAISYDPKDLSKVRVEFEVEKEFPMKKDMIAETGMSGITGLKYIEIMGGTNEAALLPPNSLIPSRPSLFGTLSDKAESILANVEELLKNLNTVTNRDSLEDLFITFRNVKELTSNVNEASVDLVEKFDSIVTSINNMTTVMEQLVNDFSEKGHLFDIMVNLDSTVISLNDLAKNFGLTFSQSREDFGATLQDLRQTMENLDELSGMLVENPSLLLYGTPQKKRKIK
ncbi:MAG: MlaD family protein [Chitinivibrionia bacterium]|nr:MlaD family protein [Chitinivibrionia bacterium]